MIGMGNAMLVIITARLVILMLVGVYHVQEIEQQAQFLNALAVKVSMIQKEMLNVRNVARYVRLASLKQYIVLNVSRED